MDGDRARGAGRAVRHHHRERCGRHLRHDGPVDDAGLIEGLFFGEPEGDREPATSWAELEEQAAALGGDVSLTVTRASGGELGERILEVLPDGVAATDARPIGSIVKLYVLGALVQAVEEGRIGWDDPLTVTDDVRSLPSGELQDAPTGTVVSVRDTAEKMIAISDNTATDMLIQAVGREAVEAALVDLGHSDPPRNVPLMTTRDLFRIGWQHDGALRARWADGDAAERRALLEALPGGVVDVPVTAVTDVVWTEGADWFATPDDIARAHLRLAELAATPAGEPVRGILGANPGLPEPARFDHVAFKGGSSVGTLASPTSSIAGTTRGPWSCRPRRARRRGSRGSRPTRASPPTPRPCWRPDPVVDSESGGGRARGAR